MNTRLRTALVVAHPDDEVIGASALLLRCRDLILVHVTDGSPLDGVDARARGFAGPSDYAAARASEVRNVLKLAGMSPLRWVRLGYTDQHAFDALRGITVDLAALFSVEQIEQVVTHPYEGGHPDHDATACAVHRAARVPVLEMTSYHAGSDGKLECGRFLPNGGKTIDLLLSPRERATKRAMMHAYRTQASTLAQFPCGVVERYRPAPNYDFTRPPHQRPLFYERCGWGTWRAA